MKASFTVRTDRRTAQGFPIVLYVRDSSIRMRFLTDICVKDASYLSEDKVSRKDRQCREKNIRITEILAKVNAIILTEHDHTTLRGKIDAIVNNKGTEATETSMKVTDCLVEFANTKKGRTKESYWNIIRKVKVFDAKATIEDVDVKWLSSFTAYCSKTMSVNGYFGHLKNLRAL